MSYVRNASVVGSLMYVMVCTRPNLAQVISVVSRYMGKPGKEHQQVVEWIFRYLKGITNIGLIYQGDTSCALSRYLDSNYAVNLDSRPFVTDHAFTIDNSLVSWKATLQPTFALSTTKAQYIALAGAKKEGIWLKGLINNLGFPQDKAIIFYDSLTANCLAKDQVHHERTKHIDFKYHFIRTKKMIIVQKVDTKENPTDMFTKPILISNFMHCLNLLNVDC